MDLPDSRVLCMCVCALLTVAHSVKVQTSLGEIEGGERTSPSGRQILSFLGVPYARPPVGEHRFKEPRPVKAWTGVWRATDFSASCIQWSIFGDTAGQIEGNEDCLYLNIYTPTTTPTSAMPVIFFIHGGAFIFGEGAGYKPDYILDRYDIVLVTINYRLGPFGFLSTEDDVVPGNNGLKDQTIALKWVHDNIAAFGGDPSRVTLAGSSAGGASVHYHFLSPLSRGLFSGGISTSGSALMPWAFTEQPLTKATRLAAAVGCPTVTTDYMIKCLRQRSSRQILSQVQSLFMPWMYNPFTPFGPSIENTTRNPFLSEHPYHLLKQGHIFEAPWLASLTTEEGLYPVAHFVDREDILESLDMNWAKIAPHLLDFNYTVQSDSLDKVGQEIRKHYLGNEAISSKNVGKVIELVGDRLFNADMNLAARLHASATTAPVYFYLFNYRGNISLSDMMSKTQANFGVSHFDDIFYLLAAYHAPTQLNSETDQAMVRTMTDIWASFVQTGKPGVWPTVQTDPEHLPHLLIRGPEDVKPATVDDLGNYKFWTSLGLDENVNVQFNDVLSSAKDEL